MTHYVIKWDDHEVHLNANEPVEDLESKVLMFTDENDEVIAQFKNFNYWYDYDYHMTPVYPTPTHNPWSGNNLSIADAQGGLISHSQVTWTSPSLEMDTYNPNQQLDLETDV